MFYYQSSNSKSPAFEPIPTAKALTGTGASLVIVVDTYG